MTKQEFKRTFFEIYDSERDLLIDDTQFDSINKTIEMFYDKISQYFIKDSKIDINSCERIWQLYPRKVGKDKAIKCIKESLKTYSEKEISEKVIKFKEHTQTWSKENLMFIPQGDTYFRNKRWQDDLTAYDIYKEAPLF